jgi:5-methylcytosine-specific restriction endonuclease McrA
LLLRCIPNDRLDDREVPEFLRLVLGREPSLELIDLVCRKRRGPRLPDEDIHELQRQQNWRCAICGRYLNAQAQLQVDHIMPVALSGQSDAGNYQLLCRECNQGKRALPSWYIAQPYLSEKEEPSMQLRYCVLARAKGRCEQPGCEATSLDSELHPAQIIPVARGGRWIFDNLRVLCTIHRDGEADRAYQASLQRLRQLGGARASGWAPSFTFARGSSIAISQGPRTVNVDASA